MANPLPNADSLTCWGTTINATLAFLEEKHGAAKRQRTIARLGAASRDIVAGMVLASSHYPLRALVELLEAADAECGRGDLALCTEIGKFACDYEVKALHRVFLAIANLDYWFRIAGSMWKTYYGCGRMVPQDFTSAGGRLRLDEFNPISKAFCYRFAGWAHRICELSHLRDVGVVHAQCLLDGSDACVWDATWTS